MYSLKASKEFTSARVHVRLGEMIRKATLPAQVQDGLSEGEMETEPGRPLEHLDNSAGEKSWRPESRPWQWEEGMG